MIEAGYYVSMKLMTSLCSEDRELRELILPTLVRPEMFQIT
jgi:hypothetical protein